MIVSDHNSQTQCRIYICIIWTTMNWPRTTKLKHLIALFWRFYIDLLLSPLKWHVVIWSGAECVVLGLGYVRTFETVPGDNTHYYDMDAAGHDQLMPCPGGTVFDVDSCRCVQGHHVVSTYIFNNPWDFVQLFRVIQFIILSQYYYKIEINEFIQIRLRVVYLSSKTCMMYLFNTYNIFYFMC